MEWLMVAVKWEDITSLARFNLQDDFEAKRLYKLSVGFLVKETDEYVVIADDLDLTLSPDSCNNYGTLIPKGCVRRWQVIQRFPISLADAGGQEKGSPSEGADPHQLLDFLSQNPHLVATAREIALGMGLEEETVARQLNQLERRELVAKIGDPGRQIYAPRGKSFHRRKEGHCQPARDREESPASARISAD